MKMSSSQRRDVLLTLRQVALAFSSIPGRFGIEGETYYWTSGYHLNIRLYEKLLFGLFDVLEESQIIEVWTLHFMCCSVTKYMIMFESVPGSRRDLEAGQINLVNVGHYRETASHIICLGAFSTGINFQMHHFILTSWC